MNIFFPSDACFPLLNMFFNAKKVSYHFYVSTHGLELIHAKISKYAGSHIVRPCLLSESDYIAFDV